MTVRDNSCKSPLSCLTAAGLLIKAVSQCALISWKYLGGRQLSIKTSSPFRSPDQMVQNLQDYTKLISSQMWSNEWPSFGQVSVAKRQQLFHHPALLLVPLLCWCLLKCLRHSKSSVIGLDSQTLKQRNSFHLSWVPFKPLTPVITVPAVCTINWIELVNWQVDLTNFKKKHICRSAWYLHRLHHARSPAGSPWGAARSQS